MTRWRKTEWWMWDNLEWVGMTLITLGILLFSLSVGACCKPKTIEKPVRISVPCDLPPLSPRKGVRFAGPEEGCPSPWAICLEADDAAKLVSHLTNRRNWIEEAIAACGGGDDLLPTPTEEDP